jgi:hypothetical protein
MRRRLRQAESANWLVCTVLQGLLTWVFYGLSELSEGRPWEGQARLLVLMAIVATWCMALRTIRARIQELFRFWRMPLKDAPGVPRNMPEPVVQAVKQHQAAYARQSVWWLRLIAAGITLPFFILPIFVSAVCVGLCWERSKVDGDFLGLALLLSVLAAIVGAYFYWSVVPDSSAPAPARPRERRDGPSEDSGGPTPGP